MPCHATDRDRCAHPLPIDARHHEKRRPPFEYRRRQPDQTVLYRLVHEHLEEFLAHARETYARPLPKYVEQELRDYLKCGILAEGFTRVRCPRCRHEFLVGFSCKGRAFCPSCSGRRMAATAAHMATKVLPDVPVRQWVLSVPYELRKLMASDASVLSSVQRIFLKVVTGWYEAEAKRAGVEGPKAGAVSFTQRFGGALNVHVHFHVVYLDGAFSKDAAGKTGFHPSRAPSQTEVATITSDVARRVMRMLKRRGLAKVEAEDADGGGSELTAIDACMRVAQSTGTFMRLDGEEADVVGIEEARFDHRRRSPWSAEVEGFSVHAGVKMAAGDADGRERLVRYCARPALSLERLVVLPDGRVAYRSKYPRRGGRTHLVMTPVEFLARLAALVPPPRFPLVRYSGVLAPASTWRRDVVPKGQTTHCARFERKAAAAKEVKQRARPASGRDESSARPLPAPTVVTPAQPAPAVPSAVPTARATSPVAAPRTKDKFRGRRSTSYIDWPTLMKRSMGIDVLACPRCKRRMEAIAVITEAEVVEKILRHLRLPLRPVVSDDDTTVMYDVTGDPALDEAWGAADEREGGRVRAPPPDPWEGVDPPSAAP